MKTITFRNGDKMPLFGLGTYQSKTNDLHDAIISAIKDGYRMIDCAAYYKNEKIIGDTLQEVFNEDLVKREDLFITSKLWNNNHAPEHVEEALRNTLHDLRLDYLDLYSPTVQKLFTHITRQTPVPKIIYITTHLMSEIIHEHKRQIKTFIGEVIR